MCGTMMRADDLRQGCAGKYLKMIMYINRYAILQSTQS